MPDRRCQVCFGGWISDVWSWQLADFTVAFVGSALFARLMAKRVADHADRLFNTQQAVSYVQYKNQETASGSNS